MSKFVIQLPLQRFTNDQRSLIQRATDYAVEQHGEQKRASGEPYVIHPIAVAETIAEWGLDHEAVMAAVLHDVVEDTDVTLEDVSGRFGAKVAELVDGVTKLRLSRSPRPAADSARLEASNENLRKLLLATVKDFRVILIKLADRLHNLKTLEHLSSDKRSLIARESLQVYAPLADRMGMGQLKMELEEMGFRYAMPEQYQELQKLVGEKVQHDRAYLDRLQAAITQYLKAGQVKVISIEARQKHLYSVYKKMVKVDWEIDKIYDLEAVRVIVPDIPACYQTLGILHQHYKPLIYRIKDYIAVPKPNGYQSLHTTVFAEEGNITEIQIRTPEMHQEAEYGLAAHFFYDEQKTSKEYSRRGEVKAVPLHLRWVEQFGSFKQVVGSGHEAVEEAKLELFADRIFAFSPKGDLYELPEGATPLDFAFAVHSDLGLRALGAKVNGKMVPLDTRLENRDVVEVVTRREPAPSRDWLGIVVTNLAKSRLRSWFRAASREANVMAGRGLLEGALAAWGFKRIEDVPKRAVADVLDGLHLRNLDDLLVQIGEGTMSAHQAVRKLFPETVRPVVVQPIKRVESTGRVLIQGEDLPHSLAPCCAPAYPQPLIGYVTRGKGVTVHALGCRNVPTDVDRYVACRWEMEAETREWLLCQVEVRAINRVGLVSDVAGIIAGGQFNIAGIEAKRSEYMGDDGRPLATVRFGVEVPDLFELAKLLHRLRTLTGVLEVTRVA